MLIGALGVLADTFETACTWQAFPALHAAITAAVKTALHDACGGGVIACRFTHVYPDGPAPYYTFLGRARSGLLRGPVGTTAGSAGRRTEALLGDEAVADVGVMRVDTRVEDRDHHSLSGGTGAAHHIPRCAQAAARSRHDVQCRECGDKHLALLAHPAGARS